MFHNQSVIIHYMICKTLSDTVGQMENDKWRSQSKKSNKQQIYLPAESVKNNKTGHGDHSHPANTQDEYQGSGSCCHLFSNRSSIITCFKITSPTYLVKSQLSLFSMSTIGLFSLKTISILAHRRTLGLSTKLLHLLGTSLHRLMLARLPRTGLPSWPAPSACGWKTRPPQTCFQCKIDYHLEYELLDFIWQPFLHKPGHWRHGRFIVIVELNKLIDFSYRSII